MALLHDGYMMMMMMIYTLRKKFISRHVLNKYNVLIFLFLDDVSYYFFSVGYLCNSITQLATWMLYQHIDNKKLIRIILSPPCFDAKYL